MKKFFPLYHLYLLQLENYDLPRYIKLLFRIKGKSKTPTRKSIIWTKKIIITCTLALIFLFFLGLNFQKISNYGYLISFILFLFFPWIFYSLAVISVYPLDCLIKYLIIKKAKNKLKKYTNLVVIGVAGSYGKTTTKEILLSILSQKYKVLATKDNYNTPLGIARLINTQLTHETQILIIEMGEYVPGDIKNLTKMTDPDYVMVTGINEAHLERMGYLDKTIDSIFEIVTFSKNNSKVFLNMDDINIKNNYTKYTQDRKIHSYSKTHSQSNFKIALDDFLQNGNGIACSLTHKNKLLSKFTLPLLGSYTMGTINGVLTLADYFELSNQQVIRGLSEIKPVPHRLQKIENTNGVLVIDDSYNGNTQGVKEAILTLSQFKTRRKIYLTPGLVETGNMIKEVHIKIGEWLSRTADIVILIRNSATPYIEEGLLNKGFKKENIFWYESASIAHANLSSIVSKNDVILFQNDWPDNYV